MDLELKVALANYEKYSDKSIDWFINSWQFKRGSDEWLICRLKRRIYKKRAKQWIDKVVKLTEKWKTI